MAKIAIIGGGITGLTAAYFLAQKGHRVTVLEKEKVLGGLTASFSKKDWDWPLERFYHHFFASDKELFRLSEDLGIKNKLFFKKPATAVFIDGRIFRFDNLKSIFLFPKLNFFDKARMGAVILFLKANPFWRLLEEITATKFIKYTMGEKVYRLIWQSLFVSKFGALSEKIPASWFWTRIKKRSFSLGYFEKGTEILVDALVQKIKSLRGKILKEKEVIGVKYEKNEFLVFLKDQDFPLNFDKVIATVSPEIFSKIFSAISEKEKKNLDSLKSLGSLSLILSLKQNFLPGNTYWLNINEKDFPFVAVVEHTNFIDRKYYGNQTVLYVGGYYPVNHRFFKMGREQILEEFLPYLKRINSNYNFEKNLLNTELFKAAYSQPVMSLFYSQNAPTIKTSLSGFYWASLHHVYPEDRGINYAVSLGKRVTDEIT